MSSIVFTFGAMTTTKTVSAGDLTRIVQALRVYYLRGLPSGAALTNQQVFDKYVENHVKALKDIVKAEEGEAATRVALAEIAEPPIT